MVRVIGVSPPGLALVESQQPCAHCGGDTPVLRILGPLPLIPRDQLFFYPKPGWLVPLSPSFERFLARRYPHCRKIPDGSLRHLYWACLCVHCDRPVAEERLEDLSDLADVGLDDLLQIHEPDDDGRPLVHGQCRRAALEPLIEGVAAYAC